VNAPAPPKKGSRAALQKASKALTPQEQLFDLDKCMSAMNMYVEKFITRDAATVAADDLREQEAEDRAVKDAAALAAREQERQEEQHLKKKAANTGLVTETNTDNADEGGSSSRPAIGADTSAVGATSTPTPNTAADAPETDDAPVATSINSPDGGVRRAAVEHEHEHEQDPPQVAGVSISDMLKVPL
jgi:hypothetical protein